MQLSWRQVDWQSQTDGGVAINLLSENYNLIYQWIIKICIIFWIIVVPFRIQIMQNKFLLTEAGAYPQLPTQPKFFWSFLNLYSNLLWSFWVVSRRKIKIWIRGKKVQFITESWVSSQKRPKTSLFSNKLKFFSSNSNFYFYSRGNSEWPY